MAPGRMQPRPPRPDRQVVVGASWTFPPAVAEVFAPADRRLGPFSAAAPWRVVGLTATGMQDLPAAVGEAWCDRAPHRWPFQPEPHPLASVEQPERPGADGCRPVVAVAVGETSTRLGHPRGGLAQQRTIISTDAAPTLQAQLRPRALSPAAPPLPARNRLFSARINSSTKLASSGCRLVMAKRSGRCGASLTAEPACLACRALQT